MSDTLPLLLPEGDRMTGLTIGSLFSGMGGLDRAAEQVFNARTVWVSDIDKGACKVLAHRYPHAPNLGDITRIDWATVPRVDIITGGYPCQPFSQAGQRLWCRGSRDGRHGLADGSSVVPHATSDGRQQGRPQPAWEQG